MPQGTENHARLLAYVAPFVLYVVPTMMESTGWLGLSYEVICTAKGILSGAALWWFRRHYPAFSIFGFRLAITAGVLGCVIWVALEQLQSMLPVIRQLTAWMFQGNRVGFDPFADGGLSAWRTAFVIIRLIELAVIVPVAEELFWRGFLARYLIADDFESVSHGHFTLFSFVVVTIAFASVHPEFLAATVWGMMINALYRKTRNLWACVTMHAVTNGLLGGYILLTKNWHLW